MSGLRRICWLGTLIALASFCGGCASDVAPGTKMFANYRSPASPPNLRLWRAGAEHGLLAEYDEWSGSGKSVRHRAYWISTNPDAGVTRGKPHFVSPKQSIGLQPVPVVLPPVSPDFVPDGGFYAIVSDDGLGFTLYWRAAPEPGSAKPSDEVVGTFKLPVYEENSKAWLSVLLTPPLIILEVAVVVAIVGLFIYVNGHAD
jgi:hypothetical protein